MDSVKDRRSAQSSAERERVALKTTASLIAATCISNAIGSDRAILGRILGINVMHTGCCPDLNSMIMGTSLVEEGWSGAMLVSTASFVARLYTKGTNVSIEQSCTCQRVHRVSLAQNSSNRLPIVLQLTLQFQAKSGTFAVLTLSILLSTISILLPAVPKILSHSSVCLP